MDGASILSDAIPADSVGNWSYTPAPDKSLNEGTHHFMALATDAAGNTSSSSEAVTINIDVTQPLLSVPTAITIDALNASGVPASTLSGFLQAATATDNMSGSLTVNHDAPTTFPLGTTIVNFSAADDAGNVGSLSSQVTVSDLSAPIITPPAPAILPAENASGTAITNAMAFFHGGSATDAVDGSLKSVSPDLSGYSETSKIPLGTTTFSFSARDSAGNIGSATSTITVTDQTAPVVTAPSAVTLAATDSNGVDAAAATAFLNTASASDNVDSTVVVTHNAPSVFPLGSTVVTFSATDAAGNSSSATSTVTVTDQNAPTLNVPNGLIMMGDSVLGGLNIDHARVQSFLALATAQDNTDNTPTITHDAPSLLPFGITTVTFTATDSAANSVTATSIIVINNPEAVGDDAPAASGTGLTVAQSIALGLDPNASTTDTDGDGQDDALEIGDPANPVDSDNDGVLDVFESGSAAGNASLVSGLTLESGKVDILSNGESLSQVSAAPSGAGAPAGIAFPYGVISYTSTVASPGASQTVRLTFSEALPTGLELYKVDSAGNYTVIPSEQWSQVDAHSIDLTLTDGGAFDLDGAANGVIVDPLALGSKPIEPTGNDVATPVSSGGGGSLSPWMWLLFLVLARRFQIGIKISSTD